MQHFDVGVLTDRQGHLPLRGAPIIQGDRDHPETRHLTTWAGPGQDNLCVRHLEELQVCGRVHFLCKKGRKKMMLLPSPPDKAAGETMTLISLASVSSQSPVFLLYLLLRLLSAAKQQLLPVLLFMFTLKREATADGIQRMTDNASCWSSTRWMNEISVVKL